MQGDQRRGIRAAGREVREAWTADRPVILALAFLQAWLCIQILPLLLIGVSLLSGHLFALSGGKAANIFFVVSLLLLLLLFVFNLWIFL